MTRTHLRSPVSCRRVIEKTASFYQLTAILSGIIRPHHVHPDDAQLSVGHLIDIAPRLDYISSSLRVSGIGRQVGPKNRFANRHLFPAPTVINGHYKFIKSDAKRKCLTVDESNLKAGTMKVLRSHTSPNMDTK
jgi:hypothetical protein